MTGRDLYDQLGSSIVNNIGVSSNNSWTLNAFIDGEPTTLAKADITRSNTDVVVDSKTVDLTKVGGGTDLSELKDMEQGKWYELKMDADDNVKDATELTYKNGTLYTSVEDKEGFSVSPEVETVLCLSSDKDKAFDDCDDKYTGRKGLEDAIRNLDTNFKGELNVVFDKGDAVVIILVDKTGGKDEGGPSGDSEVSKEVVAFLNGD